MSYNEPEEFTGVCDRCGETKTVFYSIDPYLREAWPDDENEKSLWCWDCYTDRRCEV